MLGVEAFLLFACIWAAARSLAFPVAEDGGRPSVNDPHLVVATWGEALPDPPRPHRRPYLRAGARLPQDLDA